MRKLTLTLYEREILLDKIYPVAFFGSLIWLVGEVLFGWLFITTSLLPNYFPLIFLVMTPINIILFIISYKLAKKKRNILGTSLFFIFAFTSGIFSVPIIILIGNINLYLYGMFSIGLGSMFIIFIVGKILNHNYFNKGYHWMHNILVVIGVILLELLLIYTLNITSLFIIILSVFFLTFISYTFMYESVFLAKQIREDYWLVWALKILLFVISYLLVFWIIIFLIVIVRVDFSGLENFPLGMKRRKYKKKRVF